jgi:hypothetical protein
VSGASYPRAPVPSASPPKRAAALHVLTTASCMALLHSAPCVWRTICVSVRPCLGKCCWLSLRRAAVAEAPSYRGLGDVAALFWLPALAVHRPLLLPRFGSSCLARHLYLLGGTRSAFTFERRVADCSQ